MEKGLTDLQQIHQAVIKIAGNDSSLNSMDLCRKVIAELGLPPMAVNPLVAESFESNLKYLDRPDWLL